MVVARSTLTRYNHVMPPNSYGCDYSGASEDTDDEAAPALSRHPGVVNALFCDGSVHAVKNSISVPVWWGLSTVMGGEVISSDQY